jgi:hypothetical protein
MEVNMTLRKKQSKFAVMISKLIVFAIENGYEVTFCPEHERHIKNSLHYIGLAKDLNLFKDGKYLTKTEDHVALGEYWESLGGTWGGRFNDGNHYSLTHNGVK